MPKRKYYDITPEDLAEEFNADKGLIDGLLEFNLDELATLFGHVANVTKMPTATFKKARTQLPSFSTAKWSKFAPQFGLSPNIDRVTLDPFITPKYCLPPSLHEEMFENAWHSQDVYREKVEQTIGGKMLEPYIVPILALFQGRIIDNPGEGLSETIYSTGGDVEHEIFMICGFLFFVVESNSPDPNAQAQLFLELLSAAETNKQVDSKDMRIFGLLTTMAHFKFYSYDPLTNQFYSDETLVVDVQRISSSSSMIIVCNKVFGVLLTAYIEGLCTSTKKSEEKVKKTGGRKSTDSWEIALMLAKSCRDRFVKPVASFEDIENRGNQALELLSRRYEKSYHHIYLASVRSIPRVSIFTGVDDHKTPAELKALATRTTKESLERFLSLGLV